MGTAEGTESKEKLGKENPESPSNTKAAAGEVPLKELKLSTFVANRLAEAGLLTAQDVMDWLEAGEKINGIGGGRLEEIQKKLADGGLTESGSEEAEEMPGTSAGEATEDVGETAAAIVTEAGSSGASKTEKAEAPSAQPNKARDDGPILFALRVWLNKQGRPERTVLQHHHSQRRKSVLDLDLQGLVPFIEEFMSLPVAPVPTAAPEPPHIAEVRASRAGERSNTILRLEPGEAFEVNVRFWMRDEDLISLTPQGPDYQVRIYAIEVTSGISRPLATHPGHLSPDRTYYDPLIAVPGLPPGVHRLLTVVTVQLPGEMLDRYDGPLIRVEGT